MSKPGSNDLKSVLIIVPTYNEILNIGKLIAGINQQRALLTDYTVNILFVDDKSPDGTAKAIKKFQATMPHIHLVSGNKEGLGTAYVRAFRHALAELSPAIIVMMDADYSHDPSAIPAMLQQIADGADYVIGSRNVQGGMIPGNWPLLRIANSRVANWLARHILKTDSEITDLTGGYKAIRTAKLREIDLDNINAAGYVFQVSLLYAFVKSGAVIKEVPIKFADREFGTSKLRTKDVLEFIYRVTQMNPESFLNVTLRYAGVGIAGTLVNIAVLYSLTAFAGWSPLVALLLAIEISIICNFFLNRMYTFSHMSQSGDISRTFLLYQLGASGTAALAYALFFFFYHTVKLPYITADLVSIGSSFIVGLFYSSRLVWGKQDV